jgi:hypothetical protein
MHKLVNSDWNMEELLEQWKNSISVPIYNKGDKTLVIIKAYHCYQLHRKLLFSILLSRLSQYVDKIVGDLQSVFQHNRSTIDQIFCIHQILEEKKWEYNNIDLKEAYDSVRRKVPYNILIEFGEPMKLIELIKMCLNKTHSKVCIHKHLSDMFPIQNGLKQGGASLPLL